MENIVIIWMFSCVFAWAMVGSATSLGETIEPSGYRKFLRVLGLLFSVTAIITTPFLSPAFLVAFSVAGFHSMSAMAGFSFLLWSVMHLSGALYTVVSTGTKLVFAHI